VLQDGPIQTGSISGSFDNFNNQNWNAELITGLSFEVSARSPTSENVSSVTVRFSFTNEDGEVIETDTQSFSTGTASSTIKLEHKSQSFVTNLEYEIVSVEKLRYKHYTE
jgi:hypothetical protein